MSTESNNQVKWAFSPPPAPNPQNPISGGDISSWADKLKSQKNPFLAPNPVQTSEVKHSLPYALLGAMTVAGINALAAKKLPEKWRLPAQGGLALSSLLLPKHPLSAAVGGALFYSAISESYYKIIKSNLITSLKDATK